MSAISITTYNNGSSGVGPILTATDIKYTRRLSLMGDWSFTVPLSDEVAAAQLIPYETYLEVSVVIEGVITPLVAGRVESVRRVAPNLVQVAGYDLLRYLTYRRLINFNLWVETVYNAPTVLYYEEGSGYSVVNPGDVISFLDIGSFLFVGFPVPFDDITFGLGSVNGAPGAANWGFSDSSVDGWREPGVTDGTIFDPGTGDAYLGQSGTVLFVRPGDWLPRDVNGSVLYWMRLDPETNSDPVKLNSISIVVREPDPNDIATLIATYASAWNLTCYTSTSSPQIMQFYGETLLEALVKVGERHGENFRLDDPFAFDLCWLRDDITAATVQIMAVPDPMAGFDLPVGENSFAWLKNISVKEDTNGLFTRLYVFGAGNGAAKIDLSFVTDSAPMGYSVDAGASYIENDAAVALYGIIEGYLEVSDIGAAGGGSDEGPESSNALLQAGISYLAKHCVPYTQYTLDVVGLNQIVLPGTYINLVWQVDGTEGNPVWAYNSFTDGQLIVLESTTGLDKGALATTSLVTARVPRYPEDEWQTLAKMARDNTTYRRHPQPLLQRQVRPETYTNL